MAEKLEKIMRDILFLSKEQEQLREETLSLIKKFINAKRNGKQTTNNSRSIESNN